MLYRGEDRDYNPSSFPMLWGEDHQEIHVLKGPKLLQDEGQERSTPEASACVFISDSESS
jgi:hypothetical protein